MKSYYVTTRSGRCDIIFADSKAEANRQCLSTHCESGKIRDFDLGTFRFVANDAEGSMVVGQLGLEVWKNGKRVALVNGTSSLSSLWRWFVGDHAKVEICESVNPKIRRAVGRHQVRRSIASA